MEYNERHISHNNSIIISDLHLGQEKNVAINVDKKIIEEVEDDLGNHSELVINGDLFDEFSSPNKESRKVLKYLDDYCSDNDIKLTLIEGNHDNYNFLDYNTKMKHNIQDTTYTHGHEKVETDKEQLVIGHFHPSINIDGVEYPCYLVCENAYEGKEVVIMPSYRSDKKYPVKNYVFGDLSIDCPYIEQGKSIEEYRPVFAGVDKKFPPIKNLLDHI